jgi:S-formylglutathione hydrolase FrmB
MNGSHLRFHDNGGPQILDKLRDEGKITDLIFVSLSASRRPIYLNGVDGGDYEDLVTKDLIGHLEATYPIDKEREKRAIMGVSIGGTGALTMALRTEVFGAVGAHSSAVLPASLDDVPADEAEQLVRRAERMGLGAYVDDPKRWASISPIALVRSLDPKKLAALRIYFDAGTADRYGFAPANVMLHEALEQRGVAHTFELVQGGEHAWGSGSTQRQLPKSLAFISASFARDSAAASRPTDPKEQEPAQAGKSAASR